MKQSKIKITYYISLFINSIFTIIKIVFGVIGKSETLLVDGINTMCEFISNIISLIGNKIAHKRRNGRHPFGYGSVEYVANLFVGIIIFLLGAVLFVKAFVSKSSVPSLELIYVLLVVIVGKLLLGLYLNKKSSELNSSSLLVSAKQSFIDLYSSILTLVVIILSQFSDYISIFKYSDFAGSVVISLMIIYTGYKVIKENVLPLSGEALNDEIIEKEIEEKIESMVNVDLTHIELVKNGAYHQAQITIKLDPKASALDVVNIEKKIIKKLKNSKYNIKYVFINVEV